MIIEGGSRRGAKWFATHLMRNDEGQLVRLAEVRGLAGHDIPGWFRQMEAVSFGTRCDNYFYHANINPRDDEHLTEEQWEKAVDTLEHNLGLDGHSRFVVEHEKNGRIHRHVFWSRIDPDIMTAVSDSKTYAIHSRTADELEKEFGHEPTPRGRGPDGPNPKNRDVFRGKKSGIDPYDVKAELAALWRQSDTGQAFAAAIEEHGYILAKGDRRDFVVIDRAGDDHSLGRRCLGANATEVRARMKDVDRDALPSVDQAREAARDRASDSDDRTGRASTAPKHGRSNFQRMVEEVIDSAQEAIARRTGSPTEPSPPISAPTPASQVFDAHIREYLERAPAAKDGPTIPEQVAAVAGAEELSTFERVVAERNQALREAGGESLFIAEGLAWLALKANTAPDNPPPANRELTPFERVVRDRNEAIRENGGEPYSADGQSFWQRSIDIIGSARDRTVSWAKDAFQDVIGRLISNRHTEHDDHGFER